MIHLGWVLERSLFWVCSPNYSVSSYDMFSTHIFLYYFSVKQIITCLELDSSLSPNIPLIPFPKPAFSPLLQTICSAPWPGTSLTRTCPIVPKSCLFRFGLILISTSKLASTPVLLQELETGIAFSLSSFWLRLHSQLWLWTWTLQLPLLNSSVPCYFLSAPTEWPSTAFQLLVVLPPMAVRRPLENASLVMAFDCRKSSSPITYNLRRADNCWSGNDRCWISKKCSFSPSLRHYWKTTCSSDYRWGPHEEGFLICGLLCSFECLLD